MTDNLSCRANLTFFNFPLSRDVTIPLYDATRRRRDATRRDVRGFSRVHETYRLNFFRDEEINLNDRIHTIRIVRSDIKILRLPYRILPRWQYR